MMKQKIKIMKSLPEISDDEIKNYMDFEGLVTKHKSLAQTSARWFRWLGLVSIVVVSFGVWWLWPSHERPAKVEMHEQPAPTPTVPDQKQVTSALPTDQQPRRNKEEISPTVRDEKKENPVISSGSSNEVTPTEPEYHQAEPRDGYDALYGYLDSNILYPKEAVKDSVEGVMTVTFIINTEGKPEKIQVSRSLGAPFEAEATRLIEKMPLWKPATLNGKPVPSKISIPLTFQLNTQHAQ